MESNFKLYFQTSVQADFLVKFHSWNIRIQKNGGYFFHQKFLDSKFWGKI